MNLQFRSTSGLDGVPDRGRATCSLEAGSLDDLVMICGQGDTLAHDW